MQEAKWLPQLEGSGLDIALSVTFCFSFSRGIVSGLKTFALPEGGKQGNCDTDGLVLMFVALDWAFAIWWHVNNI